MIFPSLAPHLQLKNICFGRIKIQRPRKPMKPENITVKDEYSMMYWIMRVFEAFLTHCATLCSPIWLLDQNTKQKWKYKYLIRKVDINCYARNSIYLILTTSGWQLNYRNGNSHFFRTTRHYWNIFVSAFIHQPLPSPLPPQESRTSISFHKLMS